MTVLYLSESTASDNPVSEDAFMDSLFLKVSFFFFFFFFFKHTKAQKQCGDAHQDAEGRS